MDPSILDAARGPAGSDLLRLMAASKVTDSKG